MTTSQIDQAVGLNCIELIEIFVDRGAIVDDTLLHYPADDYAMVKFLLSRGAKIISVSRNISAITNVAGGENIEVVRLLVSHANDVELEGSCEALKWAAARGRIETVKFLIEHSFDVNATPEGCIVGETPLIAVCQSKYPDSDRIAVAKLLIKNGADVNARDETGTTAAEMLLQDDVLQEDTDLQQLLAGIGNR